MEKKTQKKKNAEKEKEKKKKEKKKHRKKKKKKKKRTHLKRTCAKKRVRHPELVRFGRFSRRHFYPEEKENKKKAALPTLLCQPCFGNPVLPTLLCHLCFANPAWRTLIFRSFIFSMFLKEAGWGDKGGAVKVFLCFSLFFVSMFFCVFSVFFCVFYMFSVFFFVFSVFFCVSAAS